MAAEKVEDPTVHAPEGTGWPGVWKFSFGLLAVYLVLTLCGEWDLRR